MPTAHQVILVVTDCKHEQQTKQDLRLNVITNCLPDIRKKNPEKDQ